MPIEPQSPNPCRPELDIGRLFKDLDRKRRLARLSRSTVCKAMGVSSASWTRLNWVGMPSAHTLVQAVAWLDADLRDYVIHTPGQREEFPAA